MSTFTHSWGDIAYFVWRFVSIFNQEFCTDKELSEGRILIVSFLWPITGFHICKFYPSPPVKTWMPLFDCNPKDVLGLSYCWLIIINIWQPIVGSEITGVAQGRRETKGTKADAGVSKDTDGDRRRGKRAVNRQWEPGGKVDCWTTWISLIEIAESLSPQNAYSFDLYRNLCSVYCKLVCAKPSLSPCTQQCISPASWLYGPVSCEIDTFIIFPQRIQRSIHSSSEVQGSSSLPSSSQPSHISLLLGSPLICGKIIPGLQ